MEYQTRSLAWQLEAVAGPTSAFLRANRNRIMSAAENKKLLKRVFSELAKGNGKPFIESWVISNGLLSEAP